MAEEIESRKILFNNIVIDNPDQVRKKHILASKMGTAFLTLKFLTHFLILKIFNTKKNPKKSKKNCVKY